MTARVQLDAGNGGWQSRSRAPGLRSLENPNLARTLREVTEFLRQYVHAIRYRPDQLTAIAITMVGKAASEEPPDRRSGAAL